MRRNTHHNDDDRPSLFGDFGLDAAASPGSPGPMRAAPLQVSMLSGLASRKPKPKHRLVSRRRWWVGGSLLLVSGLVLGVYLQTLSLVAPNTFKPAPMTERVAARPAPVPAAAVVAAPQPTAPASQTARLETVPALAPKAALAVPAAATTLDAAQKRATAPATLPQSALKPAAKADVPAPAPAPAAQGNPALTPRAAPAAAPDSTAARQRTNGTAATAGDADVDLLAALMSHPSLTPPASSANVQRAVAAPAIAPAIAPAAAPATTLSGALRATPASANARPRVDLSIATLVRECNGRADKAQALACRRRICEGYWGKAQGCPREQQGPPGQSSAAVTPATGRN